MANNTVRQRKNQMNELTSVVGIVLSAAVMIVTLMWVARDARRRKKGFAVVMLCLFTFPLGVLGWLLLRPSIPVEDFAT